MPENEHWLNQQKCLLLLREAHVLILISCMVGMLRRLVDLHISDRKCACGRLQAPIAPGDANPGGGRCQAWKCNRFSTVWHDTVRVKLSDLIADMFAAATVVQQVVRALYHLEDRENDTVASSNGALRFRALCFVAGHCSIVQ